MEIIKVKENSKVSRMVRMMGHNGGFRNYPTDDILYATAGYIIENKLDVTNKDDRKKARLTIKEMAATGRNEEALELIRKYSI